MQFWDVAIIGAPGLLIGMVFGYWIGDMDDLSFNFRIGLGVIVSFFGGMITSLIFIYSIYDLISIDTYEVLFIILSYFGGYALGVISNWSPLPEKPPKSHVIFEPDDDEFDKELEEAMGGDFKANNS